MTTILVDTDRQSKQTAGAARFSSLDGLRAVSILMVLAGHLNGTANFGRRDLGIGDYAHLGVVVFFVVSGFLITSLLLSEQEKTGAVSLKLFYARRCLRILPAAYAYMACMAVLWAFGSVRLSWRSLIHAATYTGNYIQARTWHLGHLWSLSVEEQFYLLWPAAFVLLGRRKAAWAAALVLAVAPLARALGWLVLIQAGYSAGTMFPMVADSLATGCLLALGRRWLENQAWYLALFRPACSFALWPASSC